MGVDDKGNEFTPSPDPMLEELMPMLSGVKLGSSCDVKALITPVLKREDIFGVDLTQLVLGEKIVSLFEEMIQGPGAVAAVLEKNFSD